MQNRQWRLARTPPEGWPTDGDFVLGSETAPVPGPGQALTRTLYLSLDPYQWGRRRGGVEQPGDICHGRTVSEVIHSRNDSFAEGDFIFNTNGWQEYGLTGEGISTFNYMVPRTLNPKLAPLSTAIGVLGMLGLTAWSGTVVQCKPRAGETLVVSAASGGVGQVVGQIGKLLGCRVVGIAGVSKKCDYVTHDLGLDACVSHLSDDLPSDLAAACPDGIDIYFENVGGPVFEAVAPLLNASSRISVCGMISQYGATDGRDSRAIWDDVLADAGGSGKVTVHDLFVGKFVADHQSSFLAQMGEWVADGRVKYREHLWDGLLNTPTAFSAMLRGGNFGKALVAVGADPTLDEATRARRAAGNTLAAADGTAAR